MASNPGFISLNEILLLSLIDNRVSSLEKTFTEDVLCVHLSC